jgi:predicted hydrolase (HD superfamily)
VKALLYILGMCFVAAACSAGETPHGFDPHIKPSLKQKFEASALVEFESMKREAAASKQFKVIVRTANELTPSQKIKVEETGLAVDSVSGDVFTASGSYEALLKIAGFDFVVYIELSKKLKQK